MSESTKHRAAFEVYWRLGPNRSIEQLHEALMSKNGQAPSLRTLYAWSARYGWQVRIARLEQEARVAEDEARIAAIREMCQRQAQTGVLMQQRGSEWLASIGDDVITPEAAIKAIVEGARLERLARGEVTERQEVSAEFTQRFEGFSDEELDALIEVAEGLVAGKGEASSG